MFSGSFGSFLFAILKIYHSKCVFLVSPILIHDLNLIYISKKWFASELISCRLLISGLKITEHKNFSFPPTRYLGEQKKIFFVMLKHGQQVDFSRSREVVVC